MSDAFVNQVTLDCLLNKHQYEKYVSKKISKDVDKKEKKFYRKRILNLTKDLLASETEVTNLLPDVKYAFDNYVRACIHSFKVLDSNDINQSEYENIKKIEQSREEKIDEDGEGDDKTNEDDENEYEDGEEESAKKNKNIINKQSADNILARSNIRIINPSLDSFIKIKMPQMREEMILPKQKEINLNEPSLKTKGIK
jgi:hypothetical protein